MSPDAAAPIAHTKPDQCPGALRMFPAADGLVARVRTPGGVVSAPLLRQLADTFDSLSDPRAHLTSRANIQVRSIGAGQVNRLIEDLTLAGCIPSTTHDGVRNVLGHPFAGFSWRAPAWLGDVVAGLDRMICETIELSLLPGKFLIGVDTTAEQLTDHVDIRLTSTGPQTYTTIRLPHGQAVVESRAMLAAVQEICLAFLAVRQRRAPRAWRIAELGVEGHHDIAAAVPWLNWGPVRTTPADPRIPELGSYLAPDGNRWLHVGVPGGTLTPKQLRILAGYSPHGIRITPWRTIVCPDVTTAMAHQAADELPAFGLLTQPDPLSLFHACAGLGMCHKALQDVRTTATHLAVSSPIQPSVPVYLAGCGRRCGHPTTEHVSVVATETGYVLDDGLPDPPHIAPRMLHDVVQDVLRSVAQRPTR